MSGEAVGDSGPTVRGARRRIAAQIAAVLGAVLLLLALLHRLLTQDADASGGRRTLLALCGAAAWILAFVLASPRSRRRAAAVCLSVGASLVVVEILLRAFVGPYYAAVYRLNETWLWDHVPGVRRINTFRREHGVERVAFEINSDGYRGPELRARSGAKRVVVYGDSFIAARATPLERTFVEELGRELRSGLSADVEMVNAGVVGYGPDQVLLRMDAELPRLRPDLVVVSILAENDCGDLVRNRLFEMDDSGELRRVPVVISQATRDAYDDARSALMLGKALRTAEDTLRTALYASASPGLAAVDSIGYELAMCRLEHQAAVVDRVASAMTGWADHPDADVRLLPSSDSARHKLRLMAGVLAAIRDAAKRHDVPLVLLVVPSAIDVCKGYDMDAVDPASFPHYRPGNLTAPIERIADAYGIAHVDLFAAFSETDANALYFRGGDTHWNAAGQALAAKLTARAIVERRLLR